MSRASTKTTSYRLEYDTNHEAAAGTHGDILAIAEIVDEYLKAVATRARIGVELSDRVKVHVLDLYLVVDGSLVVVGHVCGCANSCLRED